MRLKSRPLTRSNGTLLCFESQISAFLVFPVRIECLCGTYPHRLYLKTPCKPSHACAVKPEVLKSWSPFSSPEPTILLACGRNRELWENTRAKRLRMRKVSIFKLAVANTNFTTRMPVFELKSNFISIQNFKAGNVKPPGMHWSDQTRESGGNRA